MNSETSDNQPSPAPPSSPSPETPKTDLVAGDQPKTVASIIEEKAPEVFKALPKGDVAKLRSISFQQTIMRSGPLPDPAELEGYNRCAPNGADRIIAMAEKQSDHRIEIEKLVVTSQQSLAGRGQLFAFIIAITGLGLATLAAMYDKTEFAITMGGATLVTLVSAFIYSKHTERNDASKKREKTEMIQALQHQQSEIQKLRERRKKK